MLGIMNEEFCLFQTDQKRVIWEVTKYCNYHCKHCCASSSKIDTKEELTTKDFYRILDELRDFGVKEIYFSGGEPFSRKDMISILKKARKNDITCNISTNGSFLTKSIVKEIAELSLNKVHISLDSHLEKDFNEFRGGDYFIPTIKAIKLLKEQGIYVRVGTVIWKNNIHQLPQMIDFLQSLNVDEVVFNWLVKVGRLVENDNVCASLSEFDDTTKTILHYQKQYEGKIKISMHRNQKFIASEKICPAGETFFYIDPQGYVSPCSWIKKMDPQFTTKNTIKKVTFQEIIEQEEIKKYNQMKLERCQSCKTGCPAICFERNGSYFSEDPLLLSPVEIGAQKQVLQNNGEKVY